MSGTFVRVGKMKDAHGIRGELFIILFSGEAEWLDQMKTIRLVNENGPADPKTFSVKSARFHKNGMIVKSGDIKDRNEAEALKGRLLEIPEEFLVSEPGEAIYLREIFGFTILTEEQGEIGQVVGFSSNGAQDLLQVKVADGHTYEIPFVKQFVTSIDYGMKKMFMSLPVGLLGEDTGAAEDDHDHEHDEESEDSDEGFDE